MNLELIKAFEAKEHLTAEEISQIVQVFNPMEGRYQFALTYQQADELAGWKVDSVGAARKINSPLIRKVLKDDHAMRTSVVGIPFPCEGGWVLSGRAETIFVLMNDEMGYNFTFELHLNGSDFEVIPSKVTAAEIADRDDSEYTITYVNSYADDSQEWVQKIFDECPPAPILTMFTGTTMC